MKSFFLAACVAVCGSWALARADEAPKPNQGTYVVLVGAGTFTDPAIQARPTADADAQTMYDLFTNAKYAGVPAERVALLTSVPDEKRKGQKATRENVLKAVKEAVSKTGKDDLIVLGFYGRGAPAGERTAIFTTDSTVKDRSKNAVLGSDLGVELKNAKSQKICVLMDLSFKGFDAGKETLAEPTLRDVLSGVFGVGEDREAEQVVHDKVIMLSTVPATDPLTKGTNGLFTNIVAAALMGAADLEGEPDGLVTVDELTKFLEKEQANEARKIGTNAKEKEAIPFIVGEEFSHFVVTKNPTVTPMVEKQLAALAKSGLPAEVQEEGKQLLTRMPKLKTPRELRKAFQELTDGKITADAFSATRSKLKDQLKLPEAEATKFSRKVMVGSEQLMIKYIKELNAGELCVAAIRGLYRRLEEPLPADLEAQLKSPKTLTLDQQQALLKDARMRLGA
ncbi:MAG: caspase family protein, partial [Gemmataceae bacterium]